MAKEKIRVVIIGDRKIVLSTKVFVEVEDGEQKVLADIIEQLADHIRE